VEDQLDAADRVVNTLVGTQLPLDDLEVVLEMGEVATVPSGEVVEHSDLVAARKQRAHEVRADEPGPARHQHFHAWTLPFGHADAA